MMSALANDTANGSAAGFGSGDASICQRGSIGVQQLYPFCVCVSLPLTRECIPLYHFYAVILLLMT